MSGTDDIPQAFREHFARHNREALLLGSITLVSAILLWTAFYILAYGFYLLFMTTLRGGSANIPSAFLPVFAGCAILLCLLAWVFRKIRPPFILVDKKSPFEIFMDILLVLPRVTFEVWGNFSACQFPSERELRASWRLLQAMGVHGKINIQQIPLEIPKPDLRARVLLLLQLVGLIGVRRYHDDLWLILEGEKARFFANRQIRIEPELPKSAFEG